MKPQVVIADADELLLAAYRAFLVAEGFDVIAVTSGLACIEVLRRRSVTALILDSELPSGSGVHVLELLKQERIPMPPVLLLTSRPGHIAESTIPVRDYVLLIKPVVPSTVAHVMSTLASAAREDKSAEYVLNS
jgi:DNA-binding response OmpR family regulator